MNLNELFFTLRKEKVCIWVEEKNIKVAIAKKSDVLSTLKSTIQAKKEEIIKILTGNNIFSKEDFLRTEILSVDRKEAILSSVQSRLWFIEQFEKGTNAYHIPLLYTLEKNTSIEAITFALKKVISRHDALRTVIKYDEELNSIQKVVDIDFNIEIHNFESQDSFQNYLQMQINEPFELDKELPVRGFFAHIFENGVLTKSVFFLNVHHIAFDGWSVNIFQKELKAFYEYFMNAETNGLELSKPKTSYIDYSIWQNEYLKKENIEASFAYWKKKVTDLTPLDFPTDFKRPSSKNYHGDFVSLSLDTSLSSNLRDLAEEFKVPLNTIMLSAFGILLGKYLNQKDIVIGSPVANRGQYQTHDVIGYFTNIIINRIKLKRGQTFENIVKENYLDQISTQGFQDIPFEYILEELDMPKETAKNPVFQVMFSLQTFGNDDLTLSDGIQYMSLTPLEKIYKVERVDLSVIVDDFPENINVVFNYATELFKSETIEHFSSLYKKVLLKLVEFPREEYNSFTLLEEKDITKQICSGKEEVVEDKNLIELFHNQVEKSSNDLAINFQGNTLNYQDLNAKSNRLAKQIQNKFHKINSREITKDDLIPICVDKGIDMIVGILAILKTGAGYVPIVPDYPEERIRYILRDINANIILIDESAKKSIINIGISEYSLEINEVHPLTGANYENLQAAISPDNLAYVIYTSGTTGKPKGVMIEHKSIVNTLNSLTPIFQKSKDATLFSSFVFDVSVAEIFGTLLTGGCLHILSDETRKSIKKLSEYILDNAIQIAYLPPFILKELSRVDYLNLKTVIYAGEPCDKKTASYWAEKVDLYNFYGPTEVCIYSIFKKIEKDEVKLIGKPLNNIKAYVVGENNQILPTNVVGELFLSGKGVARGYFNKPEITSENFLENPFFKNIDNTSDHEKIYRTGDQVKLLEDGNLQFIGRKDDQVKIHGYRIELSEIEYTLKNYVKDAVVLMDKKDTGKLVAFLISENKTNNLFKIRKQLRLELPHYMVPSRFVFVDSYPITVNGKVDKKKLLLSSNDTIREVTRKFEEPQTHIEKEVAKIWSDTLGVNSVDLNSTFFDIGGSSLTLMIINKKIHSQFGLELPFKFFFSYSLKQISEELEKNINILV